MGFWDRLFGKNRKTEDPESDWEKVVLAPEGVNFRDEEQRSRYIMDCLEQIAVAEQETDKLTGEYSQVTSWLSDMEEIEALPPGELRSLEQKARMIQNLEQERERYLGKKNRMSDQEYQTLRKQEQTVAEGIAKLREAEKYSGLIRQDLRKLDVERQAHALRKQELEVTCGNYRGMALIFMAAIVVCLVMLAVLQFGFQMNTLLGYFFAVMAGAVAVTVVCVKYLDAQKEMGKLQRALGRLVQLQNRVKIRYVNNRNLLDYLYLKYNTDSADKLAAHWAEYQQEKEERNQFAEAEAKIDNLQQQLVAQLGRYHLKNPERWTFQTAAILDKREMVELRHELILRRQALRKQMDYNKDIAENAHREVMEVSSRFPAYRAEILEMVEKYQQETKILS